MPHYTLSVRTITATAAAAAAEITTGGTRLARIASVSFGHVTAATQNVFGLGRPAAIGVTPTTTDPLQRTLLDDATSACNVVTAWTTPPTAPTNFFRRAAPLSQKGGVFIWTFPGNGLVIPPSSSIVLWNFQAGSVVDLVVELDE